MTFTLWWGFLFSGRHSPHRICLGSIRTGIISKWSCCPLWVFIFWFNIPWTVTLVLWSIWSSSEHIGWTLQCVMDKSRLWFLSVCLQICPVHLFFHITWAFLGGCTVISRWFFAVCRLPLANGEYIKTAGLWSTIAWAMASLAEISVSECSWQRCRVPNEGGVAAHQGSSWKLWRSVLILMPRALMHVDRVCLICDESALSPAVQPDICCNPRSFSAEVLFLVWIYVSKWQDFFTAQASNLVWDCSPKRKQKQVWSFPQINLVPISVCSPLVIFFP